MKVQLEKEVRELNERLLKRESTEALDEQQAVYSARL